MSQVVDRDDLASAECMRPGPTEFACEKSYSRSWVTIADARGRRPLRAATDRWGGDPFSGGKGARTRHPDPALETPVGAECNNADPDLTNDRIVISSLIASKPPRSRLWLALVSSTAGLGCDTFTKRLLGRTLCPVLTKFPRLLKYRLGPTRPGKARWTTLHSFNPFRRTRAL